MSSFLFRNVSSQFPLFVKQLLSQLSGLLHFLSKFISQFLSFFNISLSRSDCLSSESSQLLSFNFSLMLQSCCFLSLDSFFFCFLLLFELCFSFFLGNCLIVNSFKFKLSSPFDCNLSFLLLLGKFLFSLPLLLHLEILLFSDFFFLFCSFHC